ncbi:hypothetical protein SCLCIDRAFT_1219625 [Scleroderma citrinum Foug A]|uniref:Uncharacterized protein n=1 Tax=Scleroderma citrinum Foug A TaxID=1036808 RepID=A0A0C3D8Y8_9AGAM|nr:hypothetical protein SCLCIDRAFT_1219625 [Scleroderma citrinum Foug A]
MGGLLRSTTWRLLRVWFIALSSTIVVTPTHLETQTPSHQLPSVTDVLGGVSFHQTPYARELT